MSEGAACIVAIALVWAAVCGFLVGLVYERDRTNPLRLHPGPGGARRRAARHASSLMPRRSILTLSGQPLAGAPAGAA